MIERQDRQEGGLSQGFSGCIKRRRKWGTEVKMQLDMVVTASLVNRYAATSDLLDEWRRVA